MKKRQEETEIKKIKRKWKEVLLLVTSVKPASPPVSRRRLLVISLDSNIIFL